MVASAFNDGNLIVWQARADGYGIFASHPEISSEDVVFLKLQGTALAVVSKDDPNDVVIWRVSENDLDRIRSFRSHNSRISCFVSSNFFVADMARADSRALLSGDASGFMYARFAPASPFSYSVVPKFMRSRAVTLGRSRAPFLWRRTPPKLTWASQWQERTN